ncbi:hypothetical protein JAAARDRAFT_197868 [Jaapia argillacea MUCL 33604]|uniref:Uncharacterized protein n=1 Tax=Jaapia argillacea MUCL 33604 TaxID=933084 RepID=A0A067PDU8_9AGAM|nr:hypothetical protein JAAARDRAFT_197868 [Jaapia argillacea MUCL 33604]
MSMFGIKDPTLALYRRVQEAKLHLVGPGDWETSLQVLRDEDLRCMEADEVESERTAKRPKGTGEERRKICWIWMVHRVEVGASDVMHDALRVEWTKARARAERWKEEVLLLKEEMQRVLEFLRWKSEWWQARGDMQEAEDPVIQEGLESFAAQQAAMFSAIRESFSVWWAGGEVVGVDGGKEDENEGEDKEAIDADEDTELWMVELDGEDLEDDRAICILL